MWDQQIPNTGKVAEIHEAGRGALNKMQGVLGLNAAWRGGRVWKTQTTQQHSKVVPLSLRNMLNDMLNITLYRILGYRHIFDNEAVLPHLGQYGSGKA